MGDSWALKTAEQTWVTHEMGHADGSEEFTDALVKQAAAYAKPVYRQLHGPNFSWEGCESFRYPNIARLVETAFEERLFDVDKPQIHAFLGDDGKHYFHVFQFQYWTGSVDSIGVLLGPICHQTSPRFWFSVVSPQGVQDLVFRGPSRNLRPHDQIGRAS